MGLSGLGCGWALETGSSTGTSTVESGAATMKMMSSTRITSMNGVTLISEISAMSPSCGSLRLTAMTPYSAGRNLALMAMAGSNMLSPSDARRGSKARVGGAAPPHRLADKRARLIGRKERALVGDVVDVDAYSPFFGVGA